MNRYNLNKAYKPEVLEKLHKVQLEILNDFAKICEKYGLRYFVVYGTAIGAVRHKGFIPWDDDVDVAMLREDYDKFCDAFKGELNDKYNLLTPELDNKYTCTVTHLQKKNTKFISYITKNAKYEQCIDIDIFPLDYVAEDIKKQKKQERRAVFWGRLLFLVGTPKPVILLSGYKRWLAEVLCGIAHYCLKLFRVSSNSIYKKFVKNASQYNKEKGRYVTSFEYSGCIKDKVKAEELFPLLSVPFENIDVYLPSNNHDFLTKVYGAYMEIPPYEKRTNHMPFVIQFEGEKPIYE